MDIFGISSHPKKYRRGGTFNIPVKARKGARNQVCCRTRGIDCGKIRVFEADFFLYVGNALVLIVRGKRLVLRRRARNTRVRKRKANCGFSIGTY